MVILAGPLMIGGYPLRIAITIMLYMLLALGLNIIPGFCGLLDLGFVGFYGIGAYTAGLLILKFGISFWVVLPLAALNGAIWGILLGAPTLRLTGDYFAIVTFGFSEIVVLVITNWVSLTRGPMGLPGITPPSILGRSFYGDIPYYYTIFGLLILTVILCRRLADSRLGRAFFAIREDEVAAAHCGIPIIPTKVIAFAISASLGAIGGAFFAAWFTFISPNMFKFWESVLILCMIVLGGMGSIPGTMLGAAILILLQETLRPFGVLRYVIFGLILILMMRFRPSGLLAVEHVRGEMRPLEHERPALDSEPRGPEDREVPS
ncbi:MAG: branched-chain amino acid ABC transporter permease [Nitrospinae bacterium]|nr:branched-chain amino acid ABC transporter permease [Nitrospinota bacterium]